MTINNRNKKIADKLEILAGEGGELENKASTEVLLEEIANNSESLKDLDLKDVKFIQVDEEEMKKDVLEDLTSDLDSKIDDIKNELPTRDEMLGDVIPIIGRGIENDVTKKIDKLKKSIKVPKDADEEYIIERVLKAIPENEEVVFENAEQLRDKLETLKGDEKLDKKAIRGLDEALKKLKKEIKKSNGSGIGFFGGGGGKIAYQINVDTKNFNNNLSADDNNVQKALETLDEIVLANTDEKVKSTAGDTAGFLDAKVDNETIEIVANKLKTKTKTQGIHIDKIEANFTFSGSTIVDNAEEGHLGYLQEIGREIEVLGTSSNDGTYIIKLKISDNEVEVEEVLVGETSDGIIKHLYKKDGTEKWIQKGEDSYLEIGYSIKTIEFAYDDYRFFGELGLPNLQGWTQIETIPGTNISVVNKNVNGTLKDVIKFIVNNQTAKAIIPLVFTDWENILNFGANFGGTLQFIKSDFVTNNNFVGKGFPAVDDPRNGSNIRSRFGMFVSENNDFIQLNLEGSTGLILDGTNGTPIVKTADFFTYNIKVEETPDGGDNFGITKLSVNGVLLREGTISASNNAANNIITVGNSSGSGETEFYYDNFGSTTYKESNLKTLTEMDLAKNVLKIVIPPGIRDYVIEFPDNIIKALGTKIILIAQNVGGTITLKNTGAIKEWLFDKLNMVTYSIDRIQDIELTNISSDKNIFITEEEITLKNLASTTGWVTGGIIEKTDIPSANFNLATDLEILIVNNKTKTKKEFIIPAQDNIPTGLTAGQERWIMVRMVGAVGEEVAEYEFIDSPNPKDHHEMVQIGRVFMANDGNVSGVNNIPVPSYGSSATNNEIIRATTTSRNISGNEYFLFGANLTLGKTGGEAWRFGASAKDTPDTPNYVEDPAIAEITNYEIATKDSTNFVEVSTIPTTKYDDGNGINNLGTIPPNKFAVMPILYWPKTNLTGLSYPQEQFFSTIQDAVDNFNVSEYVFSPHNIGTAICRGFIIFKEGITDFTDPATSFIDIQDFPLNFEGTISGGGGGGGATTAENVSIATGVGTPTVNQVQAYLDKTGSSGFFTGGELSDGGSGTIDIAGGEGFIRETASSIAPLLSFKWSASAGITVPNDTTRYVFVDDTGTISLNADEFVEAEDMILIGVATNEGGLIESTFNLGVRLNESIGQDGRYLRRTQGIVRDKRRGGLIMGETGTRNITLSTGYLWWGRTEYNIPAINTSVSDNFTTYSASGKENSTATQWDNLQFDNAGTLTILGNNKWAVAWFYLEPDGKLTMLYGRAEYSSEAEADEEGVPASSIPDRLSSSGVLTARLTFQKSASTGSISSAFANVFSGGAVSDHGNLSGLGDDDHPQYLLKSGATSGYIQIEYQEPVGVSGGTNVSGAWTQKKLNTIVHNTGNHASLLNNQITLEAGTYKISVKDTSYISKIRWRNITDNVTTNLGIYFKTATTINLMKNRFIIPSTKTFELQYYALGVSTTGLGAPFGQGTHEIYSSISLQKIA